MKHVIYVLSLTLKLLERLLLWYLVIILFGTIHITYFIDSDPCLENWRQKGGRQCPFCQKVITHSKSCSDDLKQYLPEEKGKEVDQREAYEGLDHRFFDDIIRNVQKLIELTLEDKFEKRGAKGTQEEWTFLNTHKLRIESIADAHKSYERFEPYDLLMELYGMNDQLL